MFITSTVHVWGQGAGMSVSMADILLYCYINWGDNERIGYPFPSPVEPQQRHDYAALGRWYDAMGQRQSATV